jgi:aspartate-semialdehyde dehydrogenase
VASLDAIDNLVPYIGGEEEKLEIETPKIFGAVGKEGIESATSLKVTAHTNRVPVRPIFIVLDRYPLVYLFFSLSLKHMFSQWHDSPRQVIDGHTACISFSTQQPGVTTAQIKEALRNFQSPVGWARQE